MLLMDAGDVEESRNAACQATQRRDVKAARDAACQTSGDQCVEADQMRSCPDLTEGIAASAVVWAGDEGSCKGQVAASSFLECPW